MAAGIQHKDWDLHSNAFGFLRQPLSEDPINDKADVVVTGLPFDLATSGRSGCRMGPAAIRKASTNIAAWPIRWPWDFNIADSISIIDAGDLRYDCGDIADFCHQVESYSHAITASGKTMLSFGGDHFVTLPLLRGHAKVHGKMALVHFDAHTDSYAREKLYFHGSMFYFAPKEGLIAPENSIQIGIRTHYDYDNHPFQVLNASKANEMSVDEIVAAIKARIGDLPVYLTFDVDCLDPAYGPGTGTPVCGGMTTDKCLQIIRGLKEVNVVGMDVVEVAPAYDHGEITALAGASIANELLHICAYKKLQKPA